MDKLGFFLLFFRGVLRQFFGSCFLFVGPFGPGITAFSLKTSCHSSPPFTVIAEAKKDASIMETPGRAKKQSVHK